MSRRTAAVLCTETTELKRQTPAHKGIQSSYVKEEWLDVGLNRSEEEAPASSPSTSTFAEC